MVSRSTLSYLGDFLVIGVNFNKADTKIRSSFAITPSALDEVYNNAKNKKLDNFFVLSTCNRTEFYACASPDLLKSLVMDQLNLNEEDFDSYFYLFSGLDAVRHFFRVTSGLDSQIIGDYEIVGQVKKSIQLSRQHKMIGTLADRVSSLAFQSSKEIKAKTNLSSGKYSVSFAAAELISAQAASIEPKRILIVGTGEIGEAMARNLRDYFPTSELTLTNRTLAHAEDVAKEVQASIIPFEKFTHHLSAFDAVITAAQSDHYLIQPQHVAGLSRILFLDLSVPQIIDPQISSMEGLTLYSVDDISSFHNDLIKQRNLEIPKAEIILEGYIEKLMEWQNVFFRRDTIRSYKDLMEQFLSVEKNQSKSIEKIFSRLIQQIKLEGYRGCAVIESINELIALEK